MKTYCTFAVVSLLLATATGAMAAPPNAHSDNTASTLTTEAVIADLVASRKAAPTQSPHDGEWYNVPAPLGGRARAGAGVGSLMGGRQACTAWLSLCRLRASKPSH